MKQTTENQAEQISDITTLADSAVVEALAKGKQ